MARVLSFIKDLPGPGQAKVFCDDVVSCAEVIEQSSFQSELALRPTPAWKRRAWLWPR